MRVRVQEAEIKIKIKVQIKMGLKHLMSGFDSKHFDPLINQGILEKGMRHRMIYLGDAG